MRFLNYLKRSVLIIIFIVGLVFALWLAFLAKPESELIGRADAANVVSRTEIKPAPMTPTPGRSALLMSTLPSSGTTSSSRATSTTSTNATLKLSRIIIPVSGVRAEQLYDSFGDSRSEGRVHRALDIRAQKGTPVLAVSDGIIKRIFYSDRGGKTLYQLSADGKVVYYYAHLDSYASTSVEGSAVKQGDVIAYVGDTGNAGSGNFHLHFAMWAVRDPKRIWEGDNINPFPLLRQF